MASSTTSEILDRLPPQNLDAERAVLGSILLRQDAIDDVAEHVAAEDFYADANKKLFARCAEIHNAGKRLDSTLLVDALKKAGEYETIGGAAYVAEVMQAVPTAAHAVHYAQIVRRESVKRQLIHDATDTLRDAYDPTADVDEMISRAEQRIFEVNDRRATGNVQSFHDVLLETFDEIEARLEGRSSGLATSFVDYDGVVGGLHAGELSILAARPSMGKTAFALNVAENVAGTGAGVLFVSLEMSQLELSSRVLFARSRVSSYRADRGYIGADERERIAEAQGALSHMKLWIDDSPTRTVSDIASAARRIKRRDGLELVVVDYLQLIRPDNERSPRQEQVAAIARRLKGLARDLQVPVLCLAQLNRQAEAAGTDKRPKLSHLRESGAIEQDADVVTFIHRPEYFMTREAAEDAGAVGKAELIVAKQRNGPTGEVPVVWSGKFCRFDNAADEATGMDF